MAAEGRELFVADLHLGKAEVFQAHGIPMPSDGDQGTLNPLLELCHAWSPQRLFVLGDLVHARIGITASLRETLLALPDLCGCPVVLICLLYTSPSPRDKRQSRMPSSA